MTAYIKLSTLEYPRHIGDIEIDEDKNYAQVEWVDRPDYDPLTQQCHEGLPILENDVWRMTWVVDNLPQEGV